MFEIILMNIHEKVSKLIFFLIFIYFSIQFFVYELIVYSFLKASKLPMSIIIVGVGPAEFDGE